MRIVQSESRTSGKRLLRNLPTCVAVVVLLSLAAIVSGCDDGSPRLVVRGDYDAPASWASLKIAGRDYWPAFYSSQLAPPKVKDDPAWKIPMFTEYIPEYIGWQLDPNAIRHGFKINRKTPERYKGRTPPYCDWVDASHKANTTFELADFFPGKDVPMFNSMPTDGRPFLINLMAGSCESCFLEAEYHQDRAKYEEWKRQHPGFLGFKTPNEFNTTLHAHIWSYDKIDNPEIRERFERGGITPREGGRAVIELSRELMRRQREFHFGETNLWPMMSANFTFLHMMASFGVRGLLYEATAQGRGYWQVAGAFLRGAGRQFGIPYGWYMAHFWDPYTRPAADGSQKVLAGNNCDLPDKNPIRSKENGPEWGISESLCDRQASYGWHIGSLFLFRENAQRINTSEDETGRMVPSRTARRFARYGEMSASEERGSVYAPCAILTPIDEFFDNCGQSNYKNVKYRDDYAQCAFFTTLAPPRSEDAHYVAPRKRGLEGCLFNSPYGEMYDVLVPDSDQPEDRFLKALSAYKCAVLVGAHDGRYLAKGALRDYVLGGGTLFVSADQVADGLVDSALAGVSFRNGSTAKSGASMCDEAGRTVALEREYEWMLPDQGCTATPFLKDSNGTAVAWANDAGKGRVVTVASVRMMPLKYKKLPRTWERIGEVFSCRQPFEVIAYVLGRIRDEAMPVKIEGDVQWGVNKLKSGGWRLWLINNNGIRHFAREAAEVDPSAAVHVVATFRDSGKRLEFDIPAGEWRTEVVK